MMLWMFGHSLQINSGSRPRLRPAPDPRYLEHRDPKHTHYSRVAGFLSGPESLHGIAGGYTVDSGRDTRTFFLAAFKCSP
jgi:hypothetical protein